MMNAWEILGLSPDSDEKAIKAAYKKLAKKYHPDVNGGDKESEAKFKEISQAYTFLTEKKTEADGGFVFNDVFNEGIFNTVFRNTNFVSQVAIDPDLFINGGSFDYPVQTLERVNGRIQPVVRTTKVVVEPDTPVGAQIAVAGGPKFNFIQLIPGNTDKYRVINLIHLTEMKPINVFMAMTGGDIEVTLPNGKTGKITIPSGTQPDSIHRVRGAGLRTANGQRGDYNVQFSIVVPSLVGTDEQVTEQIIEHIKNKQNV